MARQIFDEKVLSSHRKGKSLVARIATREAKRTAIVTKSGLYVGECYVAHFDMNRTIEMFALVVRGLYFRVRKVVLPPDCVFLVRRVGGDHALEGWQSLTESQSNGPYVLGDGVFRCMFQYAEGSDATTLWILAFYDRIFYLVRTTPADVPRERTPESVS